MRIEIRYQTPYNACEWRSQWFATLPEAEAMVEFYRSCGSPAHVAPSRSEEHTSELQSH